MMNKALLWILLTVGFAASGIACAEERVNLAGDTHRAGHVWRTFERWLAAYSKGDLHAVMLIFDNDVRFSFQGNKDRRYAEMEASYVRDFQSRKPGTDWVPTVEEVYADTHMAIVRAVWEQKVRSADGSIETKARNRSMDVFRQGSDGKWRIFRSINYPEKG